MHKRIEQPQLVDPFNRVINYLRLSVTDRCNYRCNYCMPPRGYHPEGHHSEYLSFEEMTFIVDCFAQLGLKRVRITGGEPLVRKNCNELIAQLANIDGLEDISLSTNAHRLPQQASALAAAGLKRVNVSLDSLQNEKFNNITQGGDLTKVLRGIKAAKDAGLSPVKINCVVMKGVNDDEIESMFDWAIAENLILRFIEIMPIGSSGIALMEKHYPTENIIKRLEKHTNSKLIPTSKNTGGGPARQYQVGTSNNQVGVISAVSQHFCASCNRVRLTSRGVLALCLGQKDSVDLREIVRSNVSKDEMKKVIINAIKKKPERHFFNENVHNIEFRQMVSLGG